MLYLTHIGNLMKCFSVKNSSLIFKIIFESIFVVVELAKVTFKSIFWLKFL